jgi:hypothetical protein
MSYEYRVDRMDGISHSWSLKKEHELMLSYHIPNSLFDEYLRSVKLYISKALSFDYLENDEKFMSRVNQSRSNRKNITPNGAVVPKREFNLEYNLILRTWAKIVKEMSKDNSNLLKLFRTTPNIRIKYGIELEDNIKRELNTSIPHSDAWVEGPWGMNCYIPLLGDTNNNTLLYYEPIKFDEKFLETNESYLNMQWVMDNYRKIDFVPKPGFLYISDYALIHNTERKKGCDTRISIDTTMFIGDHKPHEDRILEYRNEIPNIGVDEFVDAGIYENENFLDKKSPFSHYTSKTLRNIKL